MIHEHVKINPHKNHVVIIVTHIYNTCVGDVAWDLERPTSKC